MAGDKPTDESHPELPITELAAAAAQLHELYWAYVQAGFTVEQAMQLIVALITNNNA